MTNWEKFIEDNLGTEDKREVICGYYDDCAKCILNKNMQIDCNDMYQVGEWLEGEGEEE